MHVTSHKLYKYALLMLSRGSTITIKFALSVFLARFAGLEVLGIYGLIVGLTLAVPVVLRLGLFNTLMRDLIDVPAHELSHQLGHYLLWILAVYTAIVPLTIGVEFLDLWPFQAGIALMMLAVIFLEHLALDIVALFNTLRRPNAANIFGFVQAAIWAIPFMLFAYMLPEHRTIETLLIFWIAGTAISIFFTYVIFIRLPIHKTVIEARWLVTKFKASALLFWRDGISVIASYSDRYIIALTLGLELTGVYTLFYQMANSLFTVVNSSVIQMHRPDIIVGYREGNDADALKRLKLLLKESIIIMVVLGVIISIAFYYAAPYIKRPLLEDYQPLLWLVFMAVTTRIMMNIFLLERFAKRKDMDLVKSQIFEVLFVLVIPLSLTGFIGPYAAPTGIILGCVLVMFLNRKNVMQ